MFSGVDPHTGNGYLYFETLGGGMGGRVAKDGKDGVQVHITNTSNLPVEAIEQEYPLRVEEYSLVEDSGGAGRHRGGHGATPRRASGRSRLHLQRRRRGASVIGRGGCSAASRGRRGGSCCAMGAAARRSLPDKCGEHRLARTEAVVVETPGAGGYGAPAEREPALVAVDRDSGKFTEEFITRHYEGDS